jgi:hypothetical protein
MMAEFVTSKDPLMFTSDQSDMVIRGVPLRLRMFCFYHPSCPDQTFEEFVTGFELSDIPLMIHDQVSFYNSAALSPGTPLLT